MVRYPGFSANLAMLFQDVPLLERFARARSAGFGAVEISSNELFEHCPKEVASHLKGEGLDCVLFNLPAGDWRGGERGLAALPKRQEEFLRSLQQGADYAERLGCSRVHCLAGLLGSSEIYRSNLQKAGEVLGPMGVEVLIEPINQRSMPDYHLKSFGQAERLLAEVSRPNAPVKLLFDFFHCQILHGDLTMNLRKYADIIGHVQVAGVPDRGEPDARQEVNFRHLFQVLRDELGYKGHIGCEYQPRGKTEDGLKWLDELVE
ncbi:unnamed protein product [Cladocopium goreaui]|uniref:Putative hydroxypyruvate isomerase n=1 Tax=Cladocopium goreaui TaxID=2562237 RepID=A0A9P1CK52_9DINO|nr:unnamed protein product [Cladocopium goreaui]